MTWRPYGGRYAPTAALEHLLARGGPACPQAFRTPEAWLLAAGGLGFGYKAYRGPWGLHLALEVTRPAGSGVFLRDACRRLGLAVEMEEISNARLAAKRLRQTLDESGAVLVWGAAAALPWSGLRPELVALVEHVWVVAGWSEQRQVFPVADLAPGPLTLSAEGLAAARSAPFAVQHRQLWLPAAPPEEAWRPPTADHLLAPTMQALGDPLLPGQGVAGLEEWGRWLAGDGRLPRSRRRMVHDGTEVFDVLVEIWRAVAGRTGGGALRDLWADFLLQAAAGSAAREDDALARGLEEAEVAYRRLARRWDGLATAALPPSLGLQPVRSALEERQQIFRATGPGEAVAQLDRRLTALRGEVGAELDAGSRAVEAVFEELAQRVAELAQGEAAALAALPPGERPAGAAD